MYICQKLSVSGETYTLENVNEALNMCEKCQWYYNCDEVMRLNDELKKLEGEDE